MTAPVSILAAEAQVAVFIENAYFNASTASRPISAEQDESWRLYDSATLVNTQTKEVMRIAEQAARLQRHLKGKRPGFSVSRFALPKRLRVIQTTEGRIPEAAADLKRLVREFRLARRKNPDAAILYSGAQYVIQDISPAGEVILARRGMIDGESGRVGDYHILDPHQPLPPLYLAAFNRGTDCYINKGFSGNMVGWHSLVTKANYEYVTRVMHLWENPERELPKIFSVFVSSSLLEFSEIRETKRTLHLFVKKGGETIEITAPRDPKERHISFDQIFLLLNLTPPLLLRGLKSIRIDPKTVSKTDDSETVVARMSLNGIMTFYKPKKVRSFDLRAIDFFHELGHLAATQFTGNSYLPGDARWLKAMIKDGQNASTYAQKTSAEDFAETFALYFMSQGGTFGDARQRFPNRFAILDDFFYEAFKPRIQQKIRKERKSQNGI